MKLIAMHVDDFGGLHQYDYTFDEGLNVVLHDNGWGKTTMAAFLKAMLYGYDTKRSRDITENERKRYRPWQGGKYGGYLDYESGGVRYRIYRTFGETPRFDTARVVELATNLPVRIPPDKIGEMLFHLDANAFQRSVFISQNGLFIDGGSSSIHTRLNMLVSQANDVAAFDGAIAKLTQQVKVYEKTGARGQLGDISRQIAEKERTRSRLEAEIALQDEARERIIQIDGLLARLETELNAKTQELDQLSGEGKKREAAQKMLDSLQQQVEGLRQEISALEAELGGSIPAGEEIRQARHQEQLAASLRSRIAELEASHEQLKQEHQALLDRFGGSLPSVALLDEIQSLYGEMQGILSAAAADTVAPDVPEEYKLISAVEAQQPGYTERLKNVVNGQNQLQEQQREAAAWKEKEQRFQSLTEEIAALQEAVSARQDYSPATLEPVMDELEACRKQEQEQQRLESDTRAKLEQEASAFAEKQRRYESLKTDAEARQMEAAALASYEEARVHPVILHLEELRQAQARLEEEQQALPILTGEEEALLAHQPEQLPDPADRAVLVQSLRRMDQCRATANGLSVQLEGRQSKADSLSTALNQWKTTAAAEPAAVAEPQKPAAGALMGLGIALILAGAAAGLLVALPLLALAALGLILIVCGANGKSSYQKKLQAYSAYQQAMSQWEEARDKQHQLETQLTEERTQIAALEQKLSDIRKELQQEESAVSAWMSQWGDAQEATEDSVNQIMERASHLLYLRQKQTQAEAARQAMAERCAQIDRERAELDQLYPECEGKPFSEAIAILQTNETRCRTAADKQQAAALRLKTFLQEGGLTEEALAQPESPALPKLRLQLQGAAEALDALAKRRAAIDQRYPEIQDKSYEEALDLLREKQSAYQVAEGRLQAARQQYQRFLTEAGVKQPEAIHTRCEAAQRELEEQLQACNAVLKELQLDTDQTHMVQALQEAARLLEAYTQYNRQQREHALRQTQKQQQAAALQQRLDEALSSIGVSTAMDQLPALLSALREDQSKAARQQARLAELDKERNRQGQLLTQAESAVKHFTRQYVHFDGEEGQLLPAIEAKASAHAERLAAMQQLEQQCAAIRREQADASAAAEGQEAALRLEVEGLQSQRDQLLIEYTQRSDGIRQADQALEQYPELLRELHGLYDQKQKSQNTLSLLKRTIQLITRAKENLADRYLSKVEQLFNSYMQLWMKDETVRGILDVDFHISIEENSKVHVAEGYSTGYCDMIDFCMRLALIDTLFEKEQPFLILDDPFVNLDAARLEKALELLSVMAASKQIIYFVCHPVRAAAADEASSSRAEFQLLADSTQKAIAAVRAAETKRKTVARPSPRELYRVSDAAPLAFVPANRQYTITNSIFSMDFVICDPTAAQKDGCYELFFIDAMGRVLNDRQLVELTGGKLSASRIQFSLNTREDSGSQFELMIRESGQDDYEVVARYPFKADLTFAGTFDFDF